MARTALSALVVNIDQPVAVVVIVAALLWVAGSVVAIGWSNTSSQREQTQRAAFARRGLR